MGGLIVVYNIFIVMGAIFLTLNGWWGIAILLMFCLAHLEEE